MGMFEAVLGGMASGAMNKLLGGSDPGEMMRYNLEAQQARDATNMALWERQFGPVSEALKAQMLAMLGQGPVQPESPWLSKYKDTLRQEIEGGIRPSEESAKELLLQRVRANPRSMSSQGYAKGLKDIVSAGAKARGDAFRTGISGAEMLPFNAAQAYMGRTPYQMQSPTFSPNYGFTPDPKYAELAGSGLSSLIKGGQSLYNQWFGNRVPTPEQEEFLKLSSDFGS